MRRQIVAVIVGVVVAVAVIYVLFDERVSFRNGVFSGAQQSQNSPQQLAGALTFTCAWPAAEPVGTSTRRRWAWHGRKTA